MGWDTEKVEKLKEYKQAIPKTIKGELEQRLKCPADVVGAVHLTKQKLRERYLGIAGPDPSGAFRKRSTQRCIDVKHDFQSFARLFRGLNDSRAALKFEPSLELERCQSLKDMHKIRVTPGCQCCSL